MREVLTRADAAQQIESTKERAVLVRAGNDHERLPVPYGSLEPESVRRKVRGKLNPPKSGANFIERADHGVAAARRLRARHARDAALKLLHG